MLSWPPFIAATSINNYDRKENTFQYLYWTFNGREKGEPRESELETFLCIITVSSYRFAQHRTIADTRPLRNRCNYLPIILRYDSPIKKGQTTKRVSIVFLVETGKYITLKHDSPNQFHRHVCYMIISGRLLMACFAQEKHGVSTWMSVIGELIIIRQECQLLATLCKHLCYQVGKGKREGDVVITVHSSLSSPPTFPMIGCGCSPQSLSTRNQFKNGKCPHKTLQSIRSQKLMWNTERHWAHFLGKYTHFTTVLQYTVQVTSLIWDDVGSNPARGRATCISQSDGCGFIGPSMRHWQTINNVH